MDIYQRQKYIIVKINNYLKKVLPSGNIVDLEYLKWEFGTKEAVPTKFVVSAVEKILKFDFKNKFIIIDGVIAKNE